MRNHRPGGPAAIVALLALLAGCGSDNASAPAPAGSEAADSTPAPVPSVTGRAAYDRVCAHCHDTGQAGAPRTDDPAAWTARSSLWQAVLTEHARAGYLEMPALGGDQTLSGTEIGAATEYMMSLVYPDRAMPDQ